MRLRGVSESMVPALGTSLKEQPCESQSKMCGISRHTHTCVCRVRNSMIKRTVRSIGTGDHNFKPAPLLDGFSTFLGPKANISCCAGRIICSCSDLI
jgi:hypothetical protein